MDEAVNKAIEALTSLLADENPDVRLEAARELLRRAVGEARVEAVRDYIENKETPRMLVEFTNQPVFDAVVKRHAESAWNEGFDAGWNDAGDPNLDSKNPYRVADASEESSATPTHTHHLDWNEPGGYCPGWFVTTRKDGEAFSGMPLEIWISRHSDGYAPRNVAKWVTR